MHAGTLFSRRKGIFFFSFFIAILLSFATASSAQTSDARYDRVRTVDTVWDWGATYDKHGNLFVTGGYSGTVDFDPGVGVDSRTSVGSGDIFFSKYDATGNYQWTKTFGGAGNDYGRGIAVDGNNNIYVAGKYSVGSVDFDPGPGTDIFTVSVDTAFFAKFDSSGNYQWARSTTGGCGTCSSYSHDIVSDENGNLFVSGRFGSTVDLRFGTGTDIRTSAGSFDIFIALYDASGNHVWTRVFGGSGREEPLETPSIALDDWGDIYITGMFESTVDFDPGLATDIYLSNGGSDVFFSKYDALGNYEWTKTLGGSDGDYSQSIAVDSGGNAYVAGYFSGTVDFDSGTGVDNRTSVGSSDAFLGKYDASGTYQWVRTWGGTGSDFIYSVSVDSYDNVYGTGGFADTTDFDPSLGSDSRMSVGSSDAFLVKYDTYGAYEWAKTWGGSDYDYGDYLLADRHDQIDVLGSFSGTVDFDPNEPIDLHVTGTWGLFLSRFSIIHLDNYPINLNLDINSTIAIFCDNSVNMDAIVGTGKSDITLSGNSATDNMAMCNVKTNASGGYKMEWNSSATHEANGALKSTTNATDTIGGYTMTASSETWSVAPTASEWGAKLGASSEGYGTGDAGGDYSYTSAGGWGTNDGYTNGKWMNVPVSPFQIMQKSTETDESGEWQYLVFGAQIGHDKIQPTGSYSQEVTITATTL